MKKKLTRGLAPLLVATLCSGTALAAGDGSDEPGFVPPPVNRKKPPAPPRTASSAETMDACCCCPVTPMSRTEAKKPPQPPVLITKIREGGSRAPARARRQPGARKRAPKAKGE